MVTLAGSLMITMEIQVKIVIEIGALIIIIAIMVIAKIMEDILMAVADSMKINMEERRDDTATLEIPVETQDFSGHRKSQVIVINYNYI